MLINCNALLGDLYHIDSVSRLDRFKHLFYTMVYNFYSINLIVRCVVPFIVAPAILLVFAVFKKKIKLPISMGVLAFSIISSIQFLVDQFDAFFALNSNIIDDHSTQISDEFSAYIYGYRYNFLGHLMNNMKQLYTSFINVIPIFSMMILLIIASISDIISGDGTKLLLIQCCLPFIFFIIYWYRYLTYNIDWINPANMPKSDMINDVYANIYMQRNYLDQCTTSINSTSIIEVPSRLLWILLLSILSCIIGAINYYLTNRWKDAKEVALYAIKHIYQMFLGRSVELFTHSFGEHNNLTVFTLFMDLNIFFISYVWIFYFNDLSEFVISNIYLLKNWDLCASVVRLSFESNNLKTIDTIDNLSLFIDKYICLEIPDELLTSPEDLLFERKFNNLLSFGNIKEARELIINCKNSNIKEFLMNEIKNRKIISGEC